MKTGLFLLAMILGISVSAQTSVPSVPATTAVASTCTLAVTVNGVISAATKDYLERAETEAKKRNCGSILLRINTPGGELRATRLIIERMIASSVPYLCLVTPSGGHAGSAGALILQACHVNGGLAATNVGAATPILGGGQTLTEDMRKKIVNDTVSWSQGLAKLRGRNLEFARDIVTEAKAISSEEAVQIKALDIFAKDETEFLLKSSERKVQIKEARDQSVVVGPLSEYQTDFRYKILNLVADPELAYLLFMASLALLYFEITHPGFIAPGVIGGVGLVLSLIAFHKLDVQWGGLALMLLGIGFLVAEVFVPSFGILGIGGVLALVVGSIFLFDPSVSGYSLPLSLVLTVSICLGAIFIGLGLLAMRTYRRGGKNLDAAHLGNLAVVVRKETETSGQLEILGEIWSYESKDFLEIGDKVEVLSRRGLVYTVKKIKNAGGMPS
ncbi:MAG: NfeD family protein [Pseudobdellovibrionaceae bacterium]